MRPRPRHLSCQTHAALAIVRCGGHFQDRPEAHRHSAARARDALDAIRTPPGEGTFAPDPRHQPGTRRRTAPPDRSARTLETACPVSPDAPAGTTETGPQGTPGASTMPGPCHISSPQARQKKGLGRRSFRPCRRSDAVYPDRPSMAERGAAWLAHLSGGQGVAGSNPAAPTTPRTPRLGRSSNGRTAGFGPANAGSSPARPATECRQVAPVPVGPRSPDRH